MPANRTAESRPSRRSNPRSTGPRGRAPHAGRVADLAARERSAGEQKEQGQKREEAHADGEHGGGKQPQGGDDSQIAVVAIRFSGHHFQHHRKTSKWMLATGGSGDE